MLCLWRKLSHREGVSLMAHEVTVSLVMEEVYRMLENCSIETIVAYLVGKYKWTPSVARTATGGIKRIGRERMQVLCKVMELTRSKGISMTQVMKAGAELYGLSLPTMRSISRFIPAEFRTESKAEPSAGEIATVTQILSPEQVRLVNAYLQLLGLSDMRLETEEEGEPAAGPASVPSVPGADVDGADPARAAAASLAAGTSAAWPDSADASAGTAGQADQAQECAAEATAFGAAEDRPVRAAESEEPAARISSEEPAEPETTFPAPDPEKVLAAFRNLKASAVPHFDAEALLAQLGALAEAAQAAAAKLQEIERLKSEIQHLRQDNAELEQLLALTREEADAKVAAAAERAEQQISEMRRSFEEQCSRMEEEYEAFRVVVDDFVKLPSLQQAASLGEFRPRLVYTVDRFGNVIKAERQLA